MYDKVLVYLMDRMQETFSRGDLLRCDLWRKAYRYALVENELRVLGILR